MSAGRYDVVVAGGGMVGLGLAAALTGDGTRVAVVEVRPPRRWQGGEYDLRVSALNLASQRLLEAWGAWPAMARARLGPFRRIEVRDGLAGGSVSFDAADLGTPQLGHIAENSLVQTALLDRLGQAEGFTLLAPAAVTGWTHTPDGLDLVLEDGRRLQTRLLVGADGADSTVREMTGITVEEIPYRQRGLVACVGWERPNGEVARQVFLPGGPLALLPLADGRCSIVWSLPENEAERLLEAPAQGFLDELTVACGAPLGAALDCGPRAAFPLRRLHARRYVDQRVALVGDAAHVIHPLAGQGVNLGFRDAAALADEVRRSLARGRDPGGPGALRRYQRRRREDNLTMQWAMEGFHRLFGTSNPAVALLRSTGFDLTDALTPLKREFMRRAAGLEASGRPRP